MTKPISRALAFLTMAGATACHTMTFEIAPGPVSNVVYDRKAFFVSGLFPTQEIDLGQLCPNGVVSIKEEISFTDGLLSFFTLSIYTPRSSWYSCAEEPSR